MKKRGETHHHPIVDEEKRWKTTPLGIRILTIYIGVLALLYLIFGLLISTNVFFGIITFGAIARVLNLAFLAVLVTALMGFIMKKHWAGGIASGFFMFEILNLTSSFIIRFNMMKQTSIILISICIVLLNSLILWYIYEKREYFTDLRHFKTGRADKIFITSIIFLAVLIMLSTVSYAAGMYKTTIEITDKIIKDVSGSTKEEAMFKCSAYENKERDVCYLVIATAYKNVQKEICNEIQDNFYKLTCMQAVMM